MRRKIFRQLLRRQDAVGDVRGQEAANWKTNVTWMYPVRIYQDRYGGSYSGGAWAAVDMKHKTMETSAIEEGILGGDTEVREFWFSVADAKWIAVGRTPNEALAALEAKQDARRADYPGAAVLTAMTPEQL
jgi:hypothetical protein